MKIAIIGSGISGLTAAYILDQKYDVTIYEAEDWIGGHAHTVEVYEESKTINLDTGFIVCNKVNYPNFIRLMQELNVELKKSDMSFSCSDPTKHFEYNASSFKQMIAEKNNIFNVQYYRMLLDVLKFNKYAKKIIASQSTFTIGQIVDQLKLGTYFYNNYLTPMISSIWSIGSTDVRSMPAYFICKFFDNHGLLDYANKIQWYTITNGSKTYIDKLIGTLKKPIRLATKVLKIIKEKDQIAVVTDIKEKFDKVIIATHSDQALRLLENPTFEETSALNNIPYIENQVVLHTDHSILPKNPKLWAAWNYRHTSNAVHKPTVTYNLNILHALNTRLTYCISLNQTEIIDPEKIIDTFVYAHPKYTPQMLDAQKDFGKISGLENVYFCGAYWGQGFHEDGMNSALQVVLQIDKDLLCQTQFTVAK